MSEHTRLGPPASAARRLALAALCVVLLTACDRLHQWELDRNAVAIAKTDPEARHPIGFTPRAETLDVEVPAGAEGLSPNQHADVTRFLHRYRREATERLAIVVPAGAPDRASMARSLQAIQALVAEAGVDYGIRRGRGHDARAHGAPVIRLAYQRPVAVPPECNHWAEDVGRNEDRIPYPNWGCATQRNLAVMIDNGRDLLRPQAEDPRAGERRSAIWSGYVGSPGAPAAGEGGDAGKKAPPAPKK